MSNSPPIIKVYSHPRSGTFWMCDCLYENFYKGVRDVSRMQCDPDENGTYRQYRHPSYGLFGGHPPGPETVKHPCIYMVRDVRDVLVSMYKSPMFHLEWAPKRLPGEQLPPIHRPKTFGEFLRKNINWERAPRNIIEKPYLTPAEHWVKIVTPWLRYGVALVQYEALYHHFDSVMLHLCDQFGISWDEDREFVRPGKSGRWHYKSRPGVWKDFFTSADLDYLWSIVPRHHAGLWEGDK